MVSANPLETIWRQHRIMKDCLEIAQRALAGTDVRLLQDTRFVGESSPNARKQIDESRIDVDDFVIVSLWAVFARFILSFLQEKGRKLLDARPASLTTGLYAKYEREVEYWKAKDILDLFKNDIDGLLLGDAKNVKKHRDYIAHRNPRKGSPAKVTPEFAYTILSEIVERIGALET